MPKINAAPHTAEDRTFLEDFNLKETAELEVTTELEETGRLEDVKLEETAEETVLRAGNSGVESGERLGLRKNADLLCRS